MKKFKFRLQRVLEYRHQLTKEKERLLALRNAELREAEDTLQMILSEQDRSTGFEEGILSMAELSLMGDYQQALQSALVKQRLLVLQATDAVDEAREAYREKAIEEESLEKLRERKVDEFKEERRKNERKELDSLVVQRHRFTKHDAGSGE
ncbi:MAG: flagellar export protein FliJ [Bdellovibrionota bacterium]